MRPAPLLHDELRGTRLPDVVWGEAGSGWDAWNRGDCAPGSYMKVTGLGGVGRVVWWINDPEGRVGSIVPEHHQVEEHEDGTITVAAENLQLRGALRGLVDAAGMALSPGPFSDALAAAREALTNE